MANKSAAPEPAATPAPPKSKKMLIFIVIGVAVLALVATGALLMLKKNKKASEEGADDDEPAKVEVDKKHPPVFVALEPFTVNLQPENGEQYLQIVLSLQMSDAKVGEEVKTYTPEIRHRILMLLSGKKASEIATTAGRESLAKEIRAEANTALGFESKASKKKKAADDGEDSSSGPVIEVFFTSFIVQ